MATMAMDTVQKTKLSSIFLALICSNSVFAGEWQFDPSIVINETYTDNVGITTSNERSSLVSQTGINIESVYKAQQAIVNFSSTSSYAFYSHDHDLDNDYHTIASDARIQLWPNGLILFAGIDIDNQSRNGSRNALADIVSADTVQVENYRGGVEYNINNSNIILNSSVGYLQTNSEDNIGNREGVHILARSTNGSGARHIFWDFDHNYQELKNNTQDGKLHQSEVKVGLITNYKVNPFLRYYDEDNSGNIGSANNSIESSAYGLGIRWLISSRLYLDASYNKPIGNKLDLDGSKQKEYINAAIKWQPSIRTSLAANISERFFGNSYGLNFIHRNRRLTNTISYVEDVQTLTRDSFVSEIIGYYLCPSSDSTTISDCKLQDGTTILPDNPNDPNDQGYSLFPIQDFVLVEDNAFSLNKTLTWNSTLELARTTVNFNANIRNRENLDTRVKDESSSIALRASRKISGRSNFSVDLSYNESNLQIDTTQERIDRYRRYQLSYDKSLNSALSINFAVSYLNRSSDNATFNYKEGRLSAKITKGF